VEQTLLIGLVLLAGWAMGRLAETVALPRVTGYIIAGILMNPRLLPWIPEEFPERTEIATNIALAVITFEVGGSLLYRRIKELGRVIVLITLCEAESAFLAVLLGFLALLSFLPSLSAVHGFAQVAVLCMLFAALAAPTDPSATLAVIHGRRAHGPVSSTVMGVAAMDDVMGILNYSLVLSAAGILLGGSGFTAGVLARTALYPIAGALVLGGAVGLAFNGLTRFIERESEGSWIVIIVGLLVTGFGLARWAGVDELLATMTLGAVVVNFNRDQERIFGMVERYTEELVFVLFFTLSGMHLQFDSLLSALPLVLVFVVLRAAGKFGGTAAGAWLGGAPDKVRRYAAGGLIPQGGIVVGLALTLRHKLAVPELTDVLIAVVIGTTVIHELIGPVVSAAALQRAGETGKKRRRNTS
jgi:Kef-type K+ transport system membrane component KefB